MNAPDLVDADDGLSRCAWAAGSADYLHYHDTEWGYPVESDVRLFEKICLEGFQSGLSWLTILRKRANFREAFAGFDYAQIAKFGAKEQRVLLGNAGIIRHAGKIKATINNAAKALEIRAEFGSLAAYFWQYEAANALAKQRLGEVPSQTELSAQLSKDLKHRGFRFVGPVTCYAFMQAMGLVNDHLTGCCIHDKVQQAKAAFKRPTS